jgi:cytochrome c biogenesis protein CcmG/thiol:disulfide interchange protein DsbE
MEFGEWPNPRLQLWSVNPKFSPAFRWWQFQRFAIPAISVTAKHVAPSYMDQRYNEAKGSHPVKRNVLVLVVVVAVLAMLSLAGWANWQNRKQAAARIAEQQSQAVLVPATADSVAHFSSPLVGKAAPAFTLTDLKGKKVSLADYKGKAVQLNFWATWCAPCKIETPWLIELEKQYAPKGFEILAVSFDDLDKDDPKLLAKDKEEIVKGAQSLRISYPVLIDGDSISKAYGDVEVFPTSFFVDREGKVVAASAGLTSKEDLEGNIRKALGEGN